MGTAELFANILRYLHNIVTLLVVLPFVLPPGEWLKYSCILCLMIVAAWHDGSGECQATSIEQMLRGSYLPHVEDTATDQIKLQNTFARPIIDTFLSPIHRKITAHGAHHFLYLLFLVSAIVSLFRYFIYRNIPLCPSTMLGTMYVAAITAFITLWAIGTAKRHALARQSPLH